MNINKKAFVAALIEHLEAQFRISSQAALSAHEAATHEESKSEDKHDTRGLEASYLAGAQSRRASEIKEVISYCHHLELKTFGPDDPIQPSALVELETQKKRSLYFIVEKGGGIAIPVDGRNVQVITPKSPLGEALIGRSQGEDFDLEAQGGLRAYEILSVI